MLKKQRMIRKVRAPEDRTEQSQKLDRPSERRWGSLCTVGRFVKKMYTRIRISCKCQKPINTGWKNIEVNFPFMLMKLQSCYQRPKIMKNQGSFYFITLPSSVWLSHMAPNGCWAPANFVPISDIRKENWIKKDTFSPFKDISQKSSVIPLLLFH